MGKAEQEAQAMKQPNTLPSRYVPPLLTMINRAAQPSIAKDARGKLLIAVIAQAIRDLSDSKQVYRARLFLESERAAWYFNLLGISVDYVERLLQKTSMHLQASKHASL